MPVCQWLYSQPWQHQKRSGSMPHSGGVKHLACRLTIESTTSMSQLRKSLKKEQRSLPFFIFPYAGMIQIRFNGCFLSSQADKSTPQCHFIIIPYSPFLKQILGTFQFLPIHSCLVFRLVHRHRMRWNFHTLFAPKFVCPPVEWNYKGFRSILYRHVCCCLICLKHRLMSL